MISLYNLYLTNYCITLFQNDFTFQTVIAREQEQRIEFIEKDMKFNN